MSCRTEQNPLVERCAMPTLVQFWVVIFALASVAVIATAIVAVLGFRTFIWLKTLI
jgi:hypothetical protein